MKLLTTLCLTVGFVSGAYAQQWPSFRGDRASGVADGQNTPNVWDVGSKIHIRWKIPAPGLAQSSPIVWRIRVLPRRRRRFDGRVPA
jgi:hypothetical protein